MTIVSNDGLQNTNRYLSIAKGRALEHRLESHANPATRQDSYHAAVVVSGGRIISVGLNYKSNRANDYYRGCNNAKARLDRFFSEKHKFRNRRPINDYHAEMDGILAAKTSLKGAKIFVVRVDAMGRMVNSSPCPMCRENIPKHGVARVVYSISDFEHGVWNVKAQLDHMRAMSGF